ncbi:MAG: anhydro-N-acetylmuramic acid kinase [Lysobacterales bacterium]
MSATAYIGLISGTSRDGVDAALVNIEGGRPELLHAFCNPYPGAIRNELDRLLSSGERPAAGIAAGLDEQLGRFFALTANELIQQAGIEKHDIKAVGSHGQTVWHQPDARRPVSVQLGSGSIISRSTGITTVTDFRKADIRAGGQGAPLAPLLHRHLFHTHKEHRVILNIGGIANLTFLDTNGGVSGFDCGPGNCLMDSWIQQNNGDLYDSNGTWAASGKIHEGLLEKLLDDPFFAQQAPKSTGLEYFNMRWLQSNLADLNIEAADIQCSLAELTARTVATDILASDDVARVLVCGGGVHNAYLMYCLRKLLLDIPIESTINHGFDPDWVEAILFAWLAKERLDENPQATQAITGARGPVLLGKIYERSIN